MNNEKRVFHDWNGGFRGFADFNNQMCIDKPVYTNSSNDYNGNIPVDSSNWSETSVAQPSLGDVQKSNTKQQKDDDSEPIYLDFTFISGQQNVDLNALQQIPYNNNTFTSELNSIYGNINSQAEIKSKMVNPKRRGRPPKRMPFAPYQKNDHIAEYKMPIVIEDAPIFEPPMPDPIIFQPPVPEPIIFEPSAPEPIVFAPPVPEPIIFQPPVPERIVFETIIVLPPKQTKLSVRMSQDVGKPIVLQNTTKVCRKQELKLRPDDAYEVLVEILNISNPIASSPERTNEVACDSKITETPVRPSKRLFQQRRLLAMMNKSSENTDSLEVNNSNCVSQETSCQAPHPEKPVLGLEKEIRLQKEQKPNGRVNINKKRKLFCDDKNVVVQKRGHNKGRDKEKCETKVIGKGRKKASR